MTCSFKGLLKVTITMEGYLWIWSPSTTKSFKKCFNCFPIKSLGDHGSRKFEISTVAKWSPWFSFCRQVEGSWRKDLHLAILTASRHIDWDTRWCYNTTMRMVDDFDVGVSRGWMGQIWVFKIPLGLDQHLFLFFWFNILYKLLNFCSRETSNEDTPLNVSSLGLSSGGAARWQSNKFHSICGLSPWFRHCLELKCASGCFFFLHEVMWWSNLRWDTPLAHQPHHRWLLDNWRRCGFFIHMRR